MTWEQIVTILAVVGSTFTIYFNLKKFGDNIKLEAVWRTTVNNDLKNVLDKVTELLAEHKDTARLVRELMEAKVKQDHEIEKLQTENKTIWKRLDEYKDRIERLEGR